MGRSASPMPSTATTVWKPDTSRLQRSSLTALRLPDGRFTCCGQDPVDRLVGRLDGGVEPQAETRRAAGEAVVQGADRPGAVARVGPAGLAGGDDLAGGQQDDDVQRPGAYQR